MLYRNMTGLENLRYFSKLGGHDYDEARYRSLLDEFGLQREAVEQNIDGYSKGMRQKVGIAIALAKQARAILHDEPHAGPDPKRTNAVYELSLDLNATGAPPI